MIVVLLGVVGDPTIILEEQNSIPAYLSANLEEVNEPVMKVSVERYNQKRRKWIV